MGFDFQSFLLPQGLTLIFLEGRDAAVILAFEVLGTIWAIDYDAGEEGTSWQSNSGVP